MLNKDHLFIINDFVIQNATARLWRVGDQLFEVTKDFIKNKNQEQILNKFLVKNGDKKVAELEKNLYNMLKEIILAKEELEQTTEQNGLFV